MKSKFAIFLISLSGLLSIPADAAAPTPVSVVRRLYAVNEAPDDRGSISVYDIEAGHLLVKAIRAVPNVGDVRGVAASAKTGKLYVAYRDVSGTGMVYCLNVYNDEILWNKAISPGVDRLAINPDGQLQHGKAAQPITSMSSMPIRVMLFKRYISPIDRTTRSTRYLGRSSRRRRLLTEAGTTCI
jgi:hypothetical protein